MNDKFFIDSNVFICVFDETDYGKGTRSEGLVLSVVREGIGCISYQVVKEIINAITRNFSATAVGSLRLA